MIEQSFRSRLGFMLGDHATWDHISVFPDRVEVETHYPPDLIRNTMMIAGALLGAEVRIEPADKRTRVTFTCIEEPVIVADGRSFVVRMSDGSWRQMTMTKLRAKLRRQGLTHAEATVIINEARERGALLWGDLAQILQ
ncbi:MAG: hypothetical protein ACT4QC_02315 [Planctomycetaceae bacterium]